MKIRFSVALLATLVLSALPAFAADKLAVVATTEDLASLTREVGGDRVDVTAIAKGYQDPHFVEPKPSFLLKLRSADLLVAVGRELEIAWLPQLVTGSHNPKLLAGGGGYLDASQGAEILEKPTTKVDRSAGDVHPEGNPHYWLDPDNGRVIARSIAAKLGQLRPADKAYFDGRLADFEKRLTEATKRWDAALAPYRGAQVVTYHNSWPNFLKHFGLVAVGYVEPKPGVPASPAHTLELVGLMKEKKVKAILVEPYFDRKTPDDIASRTGAEVVVLLPSVAGKPEITDYFKLFDADVAAVLAALR